MEIVKVNKPKLIKWLRGDELILQYVQSNGLITMDEYGRLNSISDPGQKTTMILDLMMKKGNGVCQEFLEMLKNDEVNESRPELKSWIATVNTSSSSLSSSGTAVTIQAQSGSTVNTSVLSNNCIGTLNTNMNPVSQNVLQERPFNDSEAFLKKNRYNLVQKVKSVDEIVDQLNFGTEMMAKVRAEQLDQDKMRKVLDFTNSRSGRELLIRVLMNHCPDVMEELINS